MRRMLMASAIFVITCISAQNAEALIVDGQRPVYTAPAAAALDAAINSAWGTVLNNVRDSLEKYDNQDKLPKGFANANTYTTNVATLQGYQDYSLFALMTGAMASIQTPAFTYDKSYIKNMRYTIERDGDLNLGLGLGIATVNAGLNAGFIIPGLYMNIKYSQIAINAENINSKMEGFTYKELLLGGGLNQLIFWPRTVPGIFRWRGLSLGAGFYYSKTESALTILKTLITEPVAGFNLIVDPSFKIQAISETMTAPLEISTAFVFFSVINFSLGTGVDFNFGHSKIKLKSAGTVTTDYTSPPDTPGYITIEGGSKEKKPTLVSPKVTAGIGLNISVVKIDIPFAVYYLDNGFSLGLSAGIVW
jgi:hypothetical protein